MSYIGLFLEDDAALAKKLEMSTAGKLMSDWWDSSSAAGPKRRPQTSFAQPIPSLEVLTVGDDQVVKNL